MTVSVVMVHVAKVSPSEVLVEPDGSIVFEHDVEYELEPVLVGVVDNSAYKTAAQRAAARARQDKQSPQNRQRDGSTAVLLGIQACRIVIGLRVADRDVPHDSVLRFSDPGPSLSWRGEPRFGGGYPFDRVPVGFVDRDERRCARGDVVGSAVTYHVAHHQSSTGML